MGTYYKRLGGAFLTSTNNICFRGGIRKISVLFSWKTGLIWNYAFKATKMHIYISNIFKSHYLEKCSNIKSCKEYELSKEKGSLSQTQITQPACLQFEQILCCLFYARDKMVSGKYFFLFLHQNVCCGYSLEAPQWVPSNEHPQHVFTEK